MNQNPEERLRGIFVKALEIKPEEINDSLTYASIPEWDSVSHMALVAALDMEYGIMMETDDVIALNGFAAAKTILAKYGIAF